ncbi:MAG: AraC family transcriptional regulator [Pseudomonadota bacterium]
MLDTSAQQPQTASAERPALEREQRAKDEARPSSHGTDHVPAITRVIRHFNTHLGKRHTLEELAEIAGCSIWHFDRVFHKITHLSPMAYLSASRMEAAKRLLVTSDALIIDICYEVGYTSLGSFGKRFTKMIGLSPRRVRTLSRRFDADEFRAMFRETIPVAPMEHPVQFTAAAPDAESEDYLVFAGLFNSEVPTLEPASCAIREGMGLLSMPAPPAGRYRAFAVGIPVDADAEDMILQDLTLRGGQDPIIVPEHDTPSTVEVEVALRPPNPLSAPLLPIMPLMLQQRLDRMK